MSFVICTPRIPLMRILGGIGSGGGDRSQLQTPKEGDWGWIKVKIDTGTIELCCRIIINYR
ncbi:hypothetical protein D0A34_17370 [Microcoleus vaginatus PCC 9802]|nr:hypothetical protein D0A34_17370 [Microcoleus vaginatus PCC 9802]